MTFFLFLALVPLPFAIAYFYNWMRHEMQERGYSYPDFPSFDSSARVRKDFMSLAENNSSMKQKMRKTILKIALVVVISWGLLAWLVISTSYS